MTIRIGLVDCDTSHCVAFTQRLNHLDVGEDQWVDGAEIVAAYPGTSEMSPERIPGFTRQLREYGVTIVEAATDLIGQVDAVLIESLQGSVHVERAGHSWKPVCRCSWISRSPARWSMPGHC